ncbi:hypothetical protein HDV05_002239 [Chytridiales sp. JEL 0842]|nr:hypothetical protein HDV05_002239 [Chytridiales sp. JEL 0842]
MCGRDFSLEGTRMLPTAPKSAPGGRLAGGVCEKRRKDEVFPMVRMSKASMSFTAKTQQASKTATLKAVFENGKAVLLDAISGDFWLGSLHRDAKPVNWQTNDDVEAGKWTQRTKSSLTVEEVGTMTDKDAGLYGGGVVWGDGQPIPYSKIPVGGLALPQELLAEVGRKLLGRCSLENTELRSTFEPEELDHRASSDHCLRGKGGLQVNLNEGEPQQDWSKARLMKLSICDGKVSLQIHASSDTQRKQPPPPAIVPKQVADRCVNLVGSYFSNGKIPSKLFYDICIDFESLHLPGKPTLDKPFPRASDAHPRAADVPPRAADDPLHAAGAPLPASVVGPPLTPNLSVLFHQKAMEHKLKSRLEEPFVIINAKTTSHSLPLSPSEAHFANEVQQCERSSGKLVDGSFKEHVGIITDSKENEVAEELVNMSGTVYVAGMVIGAAALRLSNLLDDPFHQKFHLFLGDFISTFASGDNVTAPVLDGDAYVFLKSAVYQLAAGPFTLLKLIGEMGFRWAPQASGKSSCCLVYRRERNGGSQHYTVPAKPTDDFVYRLLIEWPISTPCGSLEEAWDHIVHFSDCPCDRIQDRQVMPTWVGAVMVARQDAKRSLAEDLAKALGRGRSGKTKLPDAIINGNSRGQAAAAEMLFSVLSLRRVGEEPSPFDDGFVFSCKARWIASSVSDENVAVDDGGEGGVGGVGRIPSGGGARGRGRLGGKRGGDVGSGTGSIDGGRPGEDTLKFTDLSICDTVAYDFISQGLRRLLKRRVVPVYWYIPHSENPGRPKLASLKDLDLNWCGQVAKAMAKLGKQGFGFSLPNFSHPAQKAAESSSFLLENVAELKAPFDSLLQNSVDVREKVLHFYRRFSRRDDGTFTPDGYGDRQPAHVALDVMGSQQVELQTGDGGWLLVHKVEIRKLSMADRSSEAPPMSLRRKNRRDRVVLLKSLRVLFSADNKVGFTITFPRCLCIVMPTAYANGTMVAEALLGGFLVFKTAVKGEYRICLPSNFKVVKWNETPIAPFASSAPSTSIADLPLARSSSIPTPFKPDEEVFRPSPAKTVKPVDKAPPTTLRQPTSTRPSGSSSGPSLKQKLRYMISVVAKAAKTYRCPAAKQALHRMTTMYQTKIKSVTKNVIDFKKASLLGTSGSAKQHRTVNSVANRIKVVKGLIKGATLYFKSGLEYHRGMVPGVYPPTFDKLQASTLLLNWLDVVVNPRYHFGATDPGYSVHSTLVTNVGLALVSGHGVGHHIRMTVGVKEACQSHRGGGKVMQRRGKNVPGRWMTSLFKEMCPTKSNVLKKAEEGLEEADLTFCKALSSLARRRSADSTGDGGGATGDGIDAAYKKVAKARSDLGRSHDTRGEVIIKLAEETAQKYGLWSTHIWMSSYNQTLDPRFSIGVRRVGRVDCLDR